MTISKYPNGISSFGAPLVGPHYASMFGNYWFVDNSNASARSTGKDPANAFKTIAAAVAKATDGDTIYVRGTQTDYDESVTITKDMISLIGISSHVKDLGWTADTDATILTITGDGCVVDGFLFRPDGATSGIAIDISSAVAATYNAENTIIRNNLFKSTGATCAYAIKADGSPDYVRVINNHFTHVGYGIYCGATCNSPATGWYITGNYFSDACTYGVYLPARRCLIAENYFNAISAPVLNILGYGSSGTFNSVARNHFGGDYSITGGYIPGTSDVWTGNWATDVGEAEVEALSGAISVVPTT